MPAQPVTELQPLICRDFTSWHVTGTRFVQAHRVGNTDLFEVRHIGHRLNKVHSKPLPRRDAETLAEYVARTLTVPEAA